MNTQVARTTNYNKIIQKVICSIPVNVMNFKISSRYITTTTFVGKIFKGIFNIKLYPIFVVRVVFSVINTLKSFRIFTRKSFIFTFRATINSILSLSRRKKRGFAAVFANNWNFFFCVMFMKTLKAAKKFPSSFPRLNKKWFITLNAIGSYFGMPRTLSATYTTKSLFSLVCSKFSKTLLTNLFHMERISSLLINGQVKRINKNQTFKEVQHVR